MENSSEVHGFREANKLKQFKSTLGHKSSDTIQNEIFKSVLKRSFYLFDFAGMSQPFNIYTPRSRYDR